MTGKTSHFSGRPYDACILVRIHSYRRHLVCSNPCSDQTTVQRFMATKMQNTRNAIIWQLGVSVVVGITLCFVGIALMAHYKKIEHPIPTLTSGTWEEFQKFETTFTENHKVKPKAEDIKHFLGWSDKDVDACEKYIHRLQLKPTSTSLISTPTFFHQGSRDLSSQPCLLRQCRVWILG